MKNLKITSFYLCSLLVFSACKKDKETEEIAEFDGSIRAIEEFFSADLVQALEEFGFIINEGSSPPNIEGAYFLSPFEIAGSTVEGDEIGDLFSDYTASIKNQDNENLTVDFSGDGGGQIDNGFGSFISGNGNNFNLFLKLTSKVGNYSADTAYAISGNITNEGIENVQVAILMLDDKGDIEGVYIENNTGRLFKDSDNFSERISTTSKNSYRSNNKKLILSSN
tara:strand:- start:458 stop:1129 length:672 start_codon:yes stop_codon:yes gene_type:complete